MRWAVASITLLSTLSVVGCSSDKQPAAQSASPPVVASTSPTRSAITPANKATLKGDGWNHCGPNRDLIVRSIAPGFAAQCSEARGVQPRHLSTDAGLPPTDVANECGLLHSGLLGIRQSAIQRGCDAGQAVKKVIEAIGPAC